MFIIMEKIKSFTIDHMTLLPGVYVSREDRIGPAEAFGTPGTPSAPQQTSDEKQLYPVTTYDIRITRPNFEPVMSTGELHTIEHLGATWLRNNAAWKNRVLYWGPMGCRTGFYLILAGAVPVEAVRTLMLEAFSFIAAYEGDIPGASPAECGNYSDMDLPAARARAAGYAALLRESASLPQGTVL